MRRPAFLAVLATAFLLGACGGGEPATTDRPDTSAGAATGPQTPDAGRDVIVIEMLTDEQGDNIFRPADFEARRGDVLRFTLGSGVHNAHFLPDSNPGKQGLPPAGPLLQLPGQTYDVKVTFADGRYYFHCDPHALLGMIGHVTVLP